MLPSLPRYPRPGLRLFLPLKGTGERLSFGRRCKREVTLSSEPATRYACVHMHIDTHVHIHDVFSVSVYEPAFFGGFISSLSPLSSLASSFVLHYAFAYPFPSLPTPIQIKEVSCLPCEIHFFAYGTNNLLPIPTHVHVQVYAYLHLYMYTYMYT